MVKYYPEVYYSKTIKELLMKIPPFYPKPDYPSRPENEGSVLTGILLIGGVICTVIGLLFAIGGADGFSPLLIGGIAAIAFAFIITKTSDGISEAQFRNSGAMSKYQMALNRWEKERASYMTEERLREYRKQSYAQMGRFEYDTSVYSDRVRQVSAVQKGATETYFLSTLSNCGLFTVHGPMHVDYYRRSYYPDIVISSADGKVLFDIEIDEPYAFEDNSPIHYLDENGYSVDSERNNVFTSKGFCVVRFSEEQIIRQTQECIDYLVDIINSIKAGNIYIPQPSSQLRQKKWSLSEARQMASMKYRLAYLPPFQQKKLESISVNASVYEPRSYSEAVSDDLPF